MMEIIREDLTPRQVLEIRDEEKAKGNLVSINRIHSGLVEIEIRNIPVVEIVK